MGQALFIDEVASRSAWTRPVDPCQQTRCAHGVAELRATDVPSESRWCLGSVRVAQLMRRTVTGSRKTWSYLT